MTDGELVLGATLVAAVLLRTGHPASAILAMDPELYFDENQDFICIVQQLIAEATGLVGTGDI